MTGINKYDQPKSKPTVNDEVYRKRGTYSPFPTSTTLGYVLRWGDNRDILLYLMMMRRMILDTYRLITAYLLLRVNLDKIMHAR